MCLVYKFIECMKELRRRAAASPLAVVRRLAAARQIRVQVLVEGFVKKLLRRASARPAAVMRRCFAELKALALKKKCARRVIIFKSFDQLRLMEAHLPKVFASKPQPILDVDVGFKDGRIIYRDLLCKVSYQNPARAPDPHVFLGLAFDKEGRRAAPQMPPDHSEFVLTADEGGGFCYRNIDGGSTQ